jgi:ubiquinone/menaquinone biosynthesis C-methylase UbiE
LASFTPIPEAPSNALQAPKLDRAGLELFFRVTPFSAAKKILEIGAGSGRIAEIVLSAKAAASSHYDALDFRAQASESLRGPELKYPAQFKMIQASADGPYPFADHRYDLAFCCYVLERLRKDQLYMALAEARRLLPAGSFFSVLFRSPEESFLRRARAFLSFGREPEIELNHFISPEDWEIADDERIRSHGAISRVMLLRRKSE